MNIENEDYRDVSETMEWIEKLKDCSSRVIEHVIKELEVELSERDSNYVKNMTGRLNFSN